MILNRGTVGDLHGLHNPANGSGGIFLTIPRYTVETKQDLVMLVRMVACAVYRSHQIFNYRAPADVMTNDHLYQWVAVVESHPMPGPPGACPNHVHLAISWAGAKFRVTRAIIGQV